MNKKMKLQNASRLKFLENLSGCPDTREKWEFWEKIYTINSSLVYEKMQIKGKLSGGFLSINCHTENKVSESEKQERHFQFTKERIRGGVC